MCQLINFKVPVRSAMYVTQKDHIGEVLQGHNLMYNGSIMLKFRIRIYGARDTRARQKKNDAPS